jgi:hypothetical protein
MMPEEGGSSRLHAVYIQTSDAEHADRQDNQCDQYLDQREPAVSITSILLSS